ncbi:MAG: SCP2 sterol-binding domain-containing protein [Myxococcales bacterium]|nr:SCP2 sterol-binding domain-containing protein [Myxococcales bacterium]MCB9648893.1 SCP2 sterol-binding domain-containing protein [Deltaproteobacteria bacterium]
MSDLTAKEVFETHIPSRLASKPDVVTSINNSYQFDLTGDGGGKWVVDLTEPGGKVFAGEKADPGVTVTMTASDFVDLVNGKLNGQMAFLQGKLKIKGDMSLALKLQQVLG